MRENGGSLDFNFISLLNPTADENWVCRLHLLQFFLQKWYHSNHARCSNLFKLFMCTANLLNVTTFFCARIDLLFTIFICSHYRPWATIRLLHHFGFVMCVNSRLYCTHFSCHWHKIRKISRQLTQISKRQHDPWNVLILCIINVIIKYYGAGQYYYYFIITFTVLVIAGTTAIGLPI